MHGTNDHQQHEKVGYNKFFVPVLVDFLKELDTVELVPILEHQETVE